ncbi:Polysaccharide deacetylase [Bifidobacterium tissieri]|uniref:Polysaccharide deacetylase n=1 Tax=Bifidobacterium tissieri TaxID=1630162 RepID=A0A261FEH0_9BIFI|nr:polysaccharide deacetylase family protein [Bifidobacterium tissieri]OZG57522.1 Polysaccharide deacetylase [Bifidobacterium tissieri]
MARDFRTRKETEYTGPLFAWDRQPVVEAEKALDAGMGVGAGAGVGTGTSAAETSATRSAPVSRAEGVHDSIHAAETEVIDLAAEFIDLDSFSVTNQAGRANPTGRTSKTDSSVSKAGTSARRSRRSSSESAQSPARKPSRRPRAAKQRRGKRTVVIITLIVILALALAAVGSLSGYRYYRLAIADCQHYQYAYQQNRAHLEAVAAEVDNAGDITVSEPSGIYDDAACDAKQLPTALAGKAHKFKTAWQQVETEVADLRKKAATNAAASALLPMDRDLSGSTTAFANAIANAQWVLDNSKDAVADSSTRIKLLRAIESALADTTALQGMTGTGTQGAALSADTDLATQAAAAADAANPAFDAQSASKSADTAADALHLQSDVDAAQARAGHVHALNAAVNAVVKSQNRKIGIDCSVQKCVALTFDDGPNAVSPQVVQTLESEGVQATFFAVGQTVGAADAEGAEGASAGAGSAGAEEASISPLVKALSSGSVIGDHTWNHTDLPSMNSADRAQQLVDTNRAVQSVTGQPVRLLRPPHGAYDEASRRTAVALNLGLVDYDVDSYDWKSLNALKTREKILAQVRPGSIVLMHDIHQSTADALPDVIHDLRRLGFTLVTVPQLLDGYPAPGEVVYSRDMRAQW